MNRKQRRAEAVRERHEKGRVLMLKFDETDRARLRTMMTPGHPYRADVDSIAEFFLDWKTTHPYERLEWLDPSAFVTGDLGSEYVRGLIAGNRAAHELVLELDRRWPEKQYTMGQVQFALVVLGWIGLGSWS